MSGHELVGHTDESHTPVYYDGRYFWYGCGIIPIEGEDGEAIA